jgi:hypothetical protein
VVLDPPLLGILHGDCRQLLHVSSISVWVLRAWQNLCERHAEHMRSQQLPRWQTDQLRRGIWYGSQRLLSSPLKSRGMSQDPNDMQFYLSSVNCTSCIFGHPSAKCVDSRTIKRTGAAPA